MRPPPTADKPVPYGRFVFFYVTLYCFLFLSLTYTLFPLFFVTGGDERTRELGLAPSRALLLLLLGQRTER